MLLGTHGARTKRIMSTNNDKPPAWQRAYTIWLSGKRPNTRRAYARIVADFFQYANVPPAGVTGDMVNAWKLHLQSLGRRDTTIAQRLAGLSSFFNHLQRKAGLIDRNPVDMCERGDLDDSPYGNARPMTMTDFQAIWNELDPATPAGAMYRALFLGYTLTGKRRTELLRLHGRYMAGISLKKLAAEHGIPSPTLTRLFGRAGLVMRRNQRITSNRPGTILEASRV